MTNELAEAKAALSRIATGTNHAGDIRAVRVAIDCLDALSTPPADDVREAAETFATHIGWSWDSLEPIWQRAFTEAARKVLARPRGTVTDAAVETVPTRCGKGVPGTVPSWAGKDQIDPCGCVRPSGHEGPHACVHESPSDAVEAAREDRS